MSDLDPDVQRAVDAAETELARRLTYPTGGPEQIARDYLTWLHDHGWRPIPRPQPIERRPAGDPPNTEWRQAADRIRNRAEGDTDA